MSYKLFSILLPKMIKIRPCSLELQRAKFGYIFGGTRVYCVMTSVICFIRTPMLRHADLLIVPPVETESTSTATVH